MDSAAELLFDYLNDVIYRPAFAALDVDKLPKEFQKFGKGLLFFAQSVTEATSLAQALSDGELSYEPPGPENNIAAPLKNLQATLRHLTWQTMQVASGDYQQRISFMGEFAEAFNSMVQQLEKQRSTLLEQIEINQRKLNTLAHSNIVLDSISGQVGQWIIVIDRNSAEWIFSSREVSDMLTDPVFESQLRSLMKHSAETISDKEKVVFDELQLNNAGNMQCFSIAVYPSFWQGRRVLTFVLTDIGDERDHLQKLENAVYHDTMTQVYNRFYGMETLKEWLAENIPFVLIFVDADNLKDINDAFGHIEGDKYLICVAGVLKTFSNDAIVCRLGGDEFMILVKQWHADDAEKRMEELRRNMIQNSQPPASAYIKGISFGVVEATRDEKRSMSALLTIADECMYEYKRAYKS